MSTNLIIFLVVTAIISIPLSRIMKKKQGSAVDKVQRRSNAFVEKAKNFDPYKTMDKMSAAVSNLSKAAESSVEAKAASSSSKPARGKSADTDSLSREIEETKQNLDRVMDSISDCEKWNAENYRSTHNNRIPSYMEARRLLTSLAGLKIRKIQATEPKDRKAAEKQRLSIQIEEISRDLAIAKLYLREDKNWNNTCSPSQKRSLDSRNREIENLTKRLADIKKEKAAL